MKKLILTIGILAFFLVVGISNANAQATNTNNNNSNQKKDEVKTTPPPAPAASSRAGSAGEYKGAAFGDPARVSGTGDTTKNKNTNPTKQPAKNE